MELKSLWFASNGRLARCLTSDQDHVKSGDQGVHVALIQTALVLLGSLAIDDAENNAMRYGRTTALSVLAYKRKRDIVNRKYQTQADDIVGRMTIAALDEEMQARELGQLSISAGGVPFLRGLFFAPRVRTVVKGVVVTETNSPWVTWANTFAETFGNAAGKVTIPNGAPPALVATRLKLAALQAGPRGFLILSVGHGGVGEAGFVDEGFFDLAPGGSFRVAGRNALLQGDPAPQGQRGPLRRAHVSAFYDVRAPNPILAGGFGRSRKDEDEARSNSGAKTRLSLFRLYEDVSNTFKATGLSGVILLTCKVAGSSGFIRRVSRQWGTPVITYPRRVVGAPQSNGRTRSFLEGDPMPGILSCDHARRSWVLPSFSLRSGAHVAAYAPLRCSRKPRQNPSLAGGRAAKVMAMRGTLSGRVRTPLMVNSCSLSARTWSSSSEAFPR